MQALKERQKKDIERLLQQQHEHEHHLEQKFTQLQHKNEHLKLELRSLHTKPEPENELEATECHLAASHAAAINDIADRLERLADIKAATIAELKQSMMR